MNKARYLIHKVMLHRWLEIWKIMLKKIVLAVSVGMFAAPKFGAASAQRNLIAYIGVDGKQVK